jgi:hypothetical protein
MPEADRETATLRELAPHTRPSSVDDRLPQALPLLVSVLFRRVPAPPSTEDS